MSSKYAGMTVNERLSVGGLVDEFYVAVDQRDIDKAKAILKEVELSELSIDPILKQLGLIEKRQ